MSNVFFQIARALLYLLGIAVLNAERIGHRYHAIDDPVFLDFLEVRQKNEIFKIEKVFFSN